MMRRDFLEILGAFMLLQLNWPALWPKRKPLEASTLWVEAVEGDTVYLNWETKAS